MNKEPLLLALRERAERLNESECSEHMDNAELIRVLSRIVLQTDDLPLLHRAFGAPGDWGYGTPIGDGLRALYAPPARKAVQA